MTTLAHKTTITVTVFSREPIVIPSDGHDLYDPLLGIIHEMTEGDMIGDWTVSGATTVEGEDLRAQLVSIGNDGGFFDDPFGDDA